MNGEILHPSPIPEANGVQVLVGGADTDELSAIVLGNQNRRIVGVDRLAERNGGTFRIPLWRPRARWREEPLVHRQEALLLAWPGGANLDLHDEGG